MSDPTKESIRIHLKNPQTRHDFKAHAAKINRTMSSIGEELVEFYLLHLARANELVVETEKRQRQEADAALV